MSNFEFTESEKEIIHKMSNYLNLDENTRNLSIEILGQYKELMAENEFNFKHSLSGAILIAAKSQKIKTLDGQIIRGVGISMNQVIRAFQENDEEKTFNIKDFLFNLKEILARINIDQETQIALKEVIKRFVFIHLFHCKYVEIFNVLISSDQRFEKSHHEKDYLSKCKNFGWLLYIVLQNQLFEKNSKDIGPNALLLLCVLYEVTICIPDKFFNFGINLEGTNRSEKISDFLCKEMKIRHPDVFKEFYEKQFKNKMESLISENVLKPIRTFQKSFGIFNQEIIDYNHYELDSYYVRSLGFNNIDERLFMTEKSLQTNNEFTPFTPAHQRIHHHANNHSIQMDTGSNSFSMSVPPKKTFNAANRLLNFDASQSNLNFPHSSLNEMKNDKTVMSPFLPISNFAFKNPMQTPMSRNLEMYNWWNECIKKAKPIENKPQVIFIDKYFDLIDKNEIKKLKKTIFESIESIIKLVDESITDGTQKIFYLYLRVLDEMIKTEEKKLESKSISSLTFFDFIQNLNFHRSLVAICIETAFFIVHKNLDFQKLLSFAQIEAFDFWKMINSFIKFDKNMPQAIKDHFLMKEKTIVFNYAWKKGSIVEKLINNFEQNAENKTENVFSKCLIKTEIFIHKAEEIFFKKVVHHTANQIMELCEGLNLGERISENVWQTTVYVLSTETKILIDRDVNQIIICSIYAVCKSFGKKINFEDIIQKLTALSHNQDLTSLTRKIPLKGDDKGDIIKFYNDIFVPMISTFIKTIKKQSQIQKTTFSPLNKQCEKSEIQISDLKKPIMPLFSIQSPLKETLNSSYIANLRPMMTPMTKTLYAFGEALKSPFKSYLEFKMQRNNNANAKSSKRLNFDGMDLLKNRREVNITEQELKFKNTSGVNFANFSKKIEEKKFNEAFQNEKNLKRISRFDEEEGEREERNITPEFKKKIKTNLD